MRGKIFRELHLSKINLNDATHINEQGNDDLSVRLSSSPNLAFSLVAPLFDSPTFSKYLFKGIVCSAGGLTESTAKASLDALVKYLSNLNGKENEIEKKEEFLNKFNEIFEENLKNERVTMPLMKTLESLLRTTYFHNENINQEIFLKTHSLCAEENTKSRNITKLVICAGILGELLEFKDVKPKALRSLLVMLFNAFPKVRKLVAENLYNYLLTLEEPTVMFDNEDQYDEAIVMLSETDWGMKLKDLNADMKPSIFKIFGFEAPKKKTVAKPEESK